MDIKVLGIIENMSYIVCPDCSKNIKLFNGENIEEFLRNTDLQLLGELPMISEICNLSNDGYKNSSENLDLLFRPIIAKILETLDIKSK